jgi:hypothetical protein
MNLYYHLNLLVEEKIIRIVSTTREKTYSLETDSKKYESLPISIKIAIPREQNEKNEFYKLLSQLLQKSDYVIPQIDIEKLEKKKYNSLTLVLETDKKL